jgi:hypothetical protein
MTDAFHYMQDFEYPKPHHTEWLMRLVERLKNAPTKLKECIQNTFYTFDLLIF